MISLRVLGGLALSSDDGREVGPLLTQPKRVVLLTYLVLGRHSRRRDTITALFWPDLDTAHARAALRQATHFLQHTLGSDVIVRRGAQELSIEDRALWCDANAFDEACDHGATREALALYRGDLLEGVFASDSAPELDQWLADERSRLLRRAVDAEMSLSKECASRGEHDAAIEHARRATARAPTDERNLRELIIVLDASGDRAGALLAYEKFVATLAKDYDIAPAPETQALIATVRARATAARTARSVPLIGPALREVFAVEEELGRAEYAWAYRARDLRHGRTVSLKIVLPALATIVAPKRFRREVHLLARLQHPNIQPLYDSGECEGVLYYVAAWFDGEPLRARLRRERVLTVEEAIRVAIDVAGALAHAHAHNVMLRDLKPEGILLTHGRALVSDFGIARAITDLAAERLTETGVVLGTPAYMSPEQAMGLRDIDGRSDIYGLGCVMYEMLAGEPPFTGSAQSVAMKQMHSTAAKLHEAAINVPQRLSLIVHRMLAKDPSDRYATADDVVASLRSIDV